MHELYNTNEYAIKVTNSKIKKKNQKYYNHCLLSPNSFDLNCIELKWTIRLKRIKL